MLLHAANIASGEKEQDGMSVGWDENNEMYV